MFRCSATFTGLSISPSLYMASIGVWIVLAPTHPWGSR